MSRPTEPAEDRDGSERRGSRRQPLVRFVWYRVIEEWVDEEQHLEGIARSCDLSLTGAGLFLSRPLPREALVFLEITLARGVLSAVGRVVQATERGETWRVGVRFLVVPPNDRLLLRRMLLDED